MTPAQHIFKPKPKVFSTPLRPISTDDIVTTTLITPLNTKGHEDAPTEIEEPESVQGEREGGDQGRETTKTGRRNRLQRQAKE